MTALPTRRAFELETQEPEQRWLIEGLWAEQAVGIVGGEPKSFKSFLALELTVAVASGRPCLGRFSPRRRGRVLLFAAEDALHVVRERLDRIARAANTSLEALDVHVITAPAVRLDLEADRRRLRETVARLRPVLLVLDPFVRLHRVDENQAQDVAPLLAYLRALQRDLAANVLLVHHARKGGHVRPGQALRGSSELHAWGDSNLYLRRRREHVVLSIEHRAAASGKDLELQLEENGAACALRVRGEAQAPRPEAPSPLERVEQVLRESARPIDRRALRAACRMRMATVLEALDQLTERGRVQEVDGGLQLTP